MKKLITFLLISSAAFAAAPLVEIRDTGNVFVDGVNVGAPADAIANNPALAPAIQNALTAFVAKVRTDAAAERDAAIAASDAERALAIAAANQARDTALAAKEAEKQNAVAAANAERDAAIAASGVKDTKLAQGAARITALEEYASKLGVYIVALRGTIAGLGGTSDAPPPSPAN